MSLLPCASCGQRPRGKLIWTAWAWNNADGARVAYKASFCVPCLAQHVVPLTIKTDETTELRCIACGADCEDDLDPIYLTLAVSGAGKEQYEMPWCAACAAKERIWLVPIGSRLEDRQEVKGLGPSPALSSADVWASLGIRPRV